MKRRIWKPAAQYRSTELRELIERMKRDDADAIDEAVSFCLSESRGLWHGRARARICRNLKARNISREFQDLVVQKIGNRLLLGDFSEQFKDQLRMAIRFRPGEMQAWAERALDSAKPYVQRYAKWVLERIAAD